MVGMKKEEVKLHNAEETMHMLLGQNSQAINFIADIISCAVEEEGDKVKIIYLKDMTEKLELFKEKIDFTQPLSIVLDYTNDPTGDRAGAQVSLGYFLLRINMDHAKITKKNPLTLEGKKQFFDSNLIRPQRLHYELPPPSLKIDFNKYPLGDKVYTQKSYIMPKNYWVNACMVVLVMDTEKKTYYSMSNFLDFRTFHSPSFVLDFQEYKTKKEAKRKHKSFLEKWKKTVRGD